MSEQKQQLKEEETICEDCGVKNDESYNYYMNRCDDCCLERDRRNREYKQEKQNREGPAIYDCDGCGLDTPNDELWNLSGTSAESYEARTECLECMKLAEEPIICSACKRDFTDEVDDRSSFDEIGKIICMDCFQVCDDCGEEDCSMDGLCCPEAIERTENDTGCDGCEIKLIVDKNDPNYIPYFNFQSEEFGKSMVCGDCWFPHYWLDDENPEQAERIQEIKNHTI